jgi:hypothetical protein
MPDIDLEPYDPTTRKTITFGLFLFAGMTMLALWYVGLLFDWRGWAIAFFAFMLGLGVVARFRTFFLVRRD